MKWKRWALLGGFLAWRNRDGIRKFLKRNAKSAPRPLRKALKRAF